MSAMDEKVTTSPSPILHSEFYQIPDEEGHAHNTCYFAAADLPVISGQIRQCMIDLAQEFEPEIDKYSDWDSGDKLEIKRWCEAHPVGKRTMKDVLDFWTLQGSELLGSWRHAMCVSGESKANTAACELSYFEGLGRVKFVPTGGSLFEIKCDLHWDLEEFCKDRDYLARFLNNKDVCIKLYPWKQLLRSCLSL